MGYIDEKRKELRLHIRALRFLFSQWWWRLRRWVRFVLDLPTFWTCRRLHAFPVERQQPGLTLGDGATLRGYTIIIDNRGNARQPAVSINGRLIHLEYCHFRVLEQPSALASFTESHETEMDERIDE